MDMNINMEQVIEGPQYIVVEGAHGSNPEDYVLIEIDENMPQEELIQFAQTLNQESEVLESEVLGSEVLGNLTEIPLEIPVTTIAEIQPQEQPPAPTAPPQQSKKRKLKQISGRDKHKTKEGMYANVLKTFTKDWEAMILRVSEKEREQDRLQERREMMHQKEWEAELLRSQSEALSRVNQEFLQGLKDILLSSNKETTTIIL